MLDVTEHGIVPSPEADPVDTFPAMQALLQSIPVSPSLPGDARRAGGARLYFPVSERPYRTSQPWPLYHNRNWSLVSDVPRAGAWIVPMSSGQPVVEVQAASGSFHSVHFENLMFGGQVRIQANSRNMHEFRSCRWFGGDEVPLLLESVDGQYETHGGVVGGLLDNCEWRKTKGAVLCKGRQSDNWVVRGGSATQLDGTGFEVCSTGWKFRDVYFEQQLDPTKPWIQLRGDGQSVIDWCRFGPETSGAYAAPRNCIVLGQLATAETGYMSKVTVSCWAVGGGSESVIRVNKQCRGLFVDARTGTYTRSIVEFAHGANDDGQGVVTVAGPRPLTSTPIFNRTTTPIGWRVEETAQ